ncbi:MAG: hypothetical protein GY720_15815 [bacterium]|nr:hypothetical protein [bacterium]
MSDLHLDPSYTFTEEVRAKLREHARFLTNPVVDLVLGGASGDAELLSRPPREIFMELASRVSRELGLGDE